MVRLVSIGAIVALSGCAAVRPNNIRLYAEHVSHVSQHMGSNPTDYGYNTINLELHYEHKGVFSDIAEGYNLGAKSDWGLGYGALVGPREVFSARIGYDFKVK